MNSLCVSSVYVEVFSGSAPTVFFYLLCLFAAKQEVLFVHR